MGLLDFFSKSPVSAISDLYTTDKARIEAESHLQEQLEKGVIAQSNVNVTLASSLKLFNSGWQPMIGWTCGFLVLIYYLPQIFIATWIWAHNCIDTGIVSQFPIKPDDILNLIYLLFGFGAHSIINKKIS